MKTPDLKPCPFCGGEAKIDTDKSLYYELLGEHGMAALKMSCTKCKVEMWEQNDRIKKYDEKVEALARAWNKREGITSDDD